MIKATIQNSPYCTEMVFPCTETELSKKLGEPKELYVVNDAEHIDLYDRTNRIPFDKLEEFFKNNI